MLWFKYSNLAKMYFTEFQFFTIRQRRWYVKFVNVSKNIIISKPQNSEKKNNR